MNYIDPNATKYMVKAKINADGVVDKPDVVGAVFGQTEGLLGDDLDLRDLQKSGRIGRIEVDIVSKGGKSEGIINVSSSLDQVETVVLAAALESVDRVGPCRAGIKILGIEDVRISKRERIMERAKELLGQLVEQSRGTSADITQNIRSSVQVEEITTYGKERLPAGPNVKDSEAIIIVEGRSDVLNLLKAGIKNAVAVEGTNIPQSVQELSREKVTTAFVDGDRGGELILRELFQTSEVDFVARAPRAHEVEELSAKQLVKCLRNKVPGDQYMEMNGLSFEERELGEDPDDREERPRDRRRRDEEDHGRGRKHQRKAAIAPEDEEERYEKRRGRRGDDRFDTAEKWRKKRREEPEDEGELEGQTVDVIRREEPEDEERLDTYAEMLRACDPEEVSAEEGIPEEVAEEVAEEKPEEGPEDEERLATYDGPEEEKPAEEISKKEQKPAKKARAKKRDKSLTEEQETLRNMLLDITNTHNSVLMDEAGSEIEKVAVKGLADYLKETDSADIRTIVFDGVISQNMVDIASSKGVRTLVCKRKGKITKLPAEITIWTRDDLE